MGPAGEARGAREPTAAAAAAASGAAWAAAEPGGPHEWDAAAAAAAAELRAGSAQAPPRPRDASLRHRLQGRGSRANPPGRGRRLASVVLAADLELRFLKKKKLSAGSRGNPAARHVELRTYGHKQILKGKKVVCMNVL